MEFQAEYIELFDRLQIRYYGIIIVVGMLVAAAVAARLAKRAGQDPDHIWGGLTWAIIPAIIGARLWYILLPPISAVEAGQTTQWYFENFFNLQNGAVAIWSGGLHIFGAFVGGFLGALAYIVRNKLSLWFWLDIAGVTLPLGQAIGRWANFINQELYGTPTTLPWGIAIDRDNRVGQYASLVDYPAETRFHPLFLYESLWNFLAFIVLLNLWQRARGKTLRHGDIFLLYIMQYAFIRFLLEFLRVEVALVGGVNTSQAGCVVAFVIALVIFIARRRAAPDSTQTRTTA
ncbi:MAG: prolipoprotein diacylglyceryl transferase [bacterium]|nr:prolipoprotein diacylglyceryl transferase [bacterium]